MNEREVFFEIYETNVGEKLKANLVMVENNGEGPAYLGWCENLLLDTPETLPGNTVPTPLMLPFADLALLTHKGRPMPVPEGWQEKIVRPLTFQDYLLLTIEEDQILEPEVISSPG